ncbi:stress protein [Anaerobacillus isosaccharinicus]|uniref:Stress protein n=1 Tax=Anaerobacillus isosaccharinicus TaxID=1532552 RepID=A0A1S2L9T6_9BACI|nr:hypothetical protein [Anaerobacillus isosaccharinicus]MBA5584594.1 stress protein [Anaerobacillus isosaccharinicus]QOY37027.1 stress protein [Anaerobacillus isosaccharinicus]
MKKFVFVLLISLFSLAACGGETTSSKKDLNIDDVITAFQEAGLEAESPRDMTKDDFGIAPMKSDEAKYILIPSVCDDCGARIFSYSNQNDLEEMKAFYDELGKGSAMLFSWTMAKENILIQLNGNLSEEKYNEYKKVLEEL